MSRNEPLCQACQAWLGVALSVLSGVPPTVTQGWEITLTEGGHGAKGTWEPDYVHMVISAGRALHSLPEHAVVVDLVTADPAVHSVLCAGYTGEIPGDPEQQKNNVALYLDRYLLAYLRATADPAPPMHVAEFERIYEQLERFVYTESFPAVWLAYLRNLRSDVVTVPLETDIAIRQATPDERIEILREAYVFPGGLSAGPFVSAPEAFVEIRHSIDRTTQPDTLGPLEIARAAVVALRLLKAHPVGLSGSRWRVLDQPFTLFPAMGGGPLVTWNTFQRGAVHPHRRGRERAGHPLAQGEARHEG